MYKKNIKANISENIALNKHFRLLGLTASSEIIMPKPGQFYMLQAGHTYDPLLKRPFSIFSHKNNSLKFLYRIRGKGTKNISALKKGDAIQLIGPLGNGYPVPEGDFIAVAGGIGIASLLPLLEKYRNRALLFYGARNKDELVMLDKAKKLAKEIFVTTDDGSMGQKGMVTGLLRNCLSQNVIARSRATKQSHHFKIASPSARNDSPPSDFLNPSRITHHALRIYACGSLPMLKELAGITAITGIKCYASLEEHMACGIGACLGCAVKVKTTTPSPPLTKEGIYSSVPPLAKGWGGGVIYKRVCKEGPVFDTGDIVWE